MVRPPTTPGNRYQATDTRYVERGLEVLAGLQVLAGLLLRLARLRRRASGQAAADGRELLLGRHLLGEQRRLNTLHQSFEPTNELSLRYRKF